MPFGLKMFDDIFQMQMDQATDHLPGIIPIFHLMQTAKEHGIIFNSSKFQIRQPQIAFYGAVFTAQGMWPNPAKLTLPISYFDKSS